MSNALDTRYISGLEDNTRNAMVELLNERLADVIDLTLALKQAHWNLKGHGYIGVHELLDAVIDRCRESSDTIAERAQVIGGMARGTSQVVAGQTKMSAYPTDVVAVNDHVNALVKRMSAMSGRLREAIDAAGEAGDEGTADLFTEVTRQIDKDSWMLGSNIAP